MPYPLATLMINWATGAKGPSHCAAVLPNPDGVLSVYEATIPVARVMSVADYEDQLRTWAEQRQWWRKHTSQYLWYELWRPPYISPEQLAAGTKEAERWVGTEYSMIWNYLKGTPKIHCSEKCGRILEAELFVIWKIEYSKIKPMDIRTVLKEMNWHEGNVYCV